MTGHDLATQPAAAATESLRGWIDSVAPRLIAYAAQRAPATLAARLEEEWLADSLAQRGLAARLGFALGCLWAATVISWDCDTLAAAAAPTPAVLTATAPGHRHPGTHPFRRRTIVAPEGAPLCDINTTPLIDVMLVLLVTLIVTLPLMTHAVRLDIPQTPPLAAAVRPDVIELEVDFDGTVVWNGEALVSWQQLEGRLLSESRKTPQPQVRLLPDRRVKYDVVARVLAAVQRNRLQRIELAGTARFND
jgi:biopolymer transport protein ExbD